MSRSDRKAVTGTKKELGEYVLRMGVKASRVKGAAAGISRNITQPR